MEAIDYLNQEEECPMCDGMLYQTGCGTFTAETYAVEWKCEKCRGMWIEVFDGSMTSFIKV